MTSKASATKPRGLRPGFVAPDGGWGWCVVLAAGCSNLSTFPVLQQFGLLFRDRLTTLGLSGKEITTIINLNSCVTSCLGLLNGPLFRYFTYRQVAAFSALLCAIGVLCTSAANSFGTYALTFSVLYGAGCGLNQSANSLALNTYFRERRRIATGISWTATALGPILFPQVIAVLLPLYGVQGTVLLFGALALNAIAMAMVYQPVEWHMRPVDRSTTDAEEDQPGTVTSTSQATGDCDHCRRQQQLATIDGYAIVDPGTPMLAHANDGWFSATPAKRSLYSSRVSLATSAFASRNPSVANNMQAFRRQTSANKADEEAAGTNNGAAAAAIEVRSNRVSFAKDLAKEAKRDKLKATTNELKIDEAEIEDCPSFKAPQDLKAGPDAVPTSEPADRENRPMFIINDGFKRKSSTHRSASSAAAASAAAAAAAAADEQLLAAATAGWLTVKSTEPTRNQSALSIFDMTPRRNFSTASFHGEKEVLRSVRNRLEQYMNDEEADQGTAASSSCTRCTCNRRASDPDALHEDEDRFTWWQRLFIFFDLDLLRDPSYVNLMVGVTIASFAELNYSILTPFVLADFGLSKTQTATTMSLLGLMDISVRFFVPFLAGRIGWENKTFFLVGVLGMALGRISIAHFHSYPAVLAASVWIGLNKGLRTVFMALVIPSYVSLERLPGATGLQLLFAGIFYFVMGPVIGWIRDTTNYTVTLHCLNVATYTTAVCWGLEMWCQRRRRQRKQRKTSL